MITSLEPWVPPGRKLAMKYLSLLIFLPVVLVAESVSYGEDPFVMGMSIDAYALGNIKALPMANPSPGANVAYLTGRDQKLGFQHTEGFGGVYQTDVLSGNKDNWSLVLFRGGVSGIPDTRDALLDYGSDGVADTDDADGSENNGQLDPGERLSINSISYFSTQQLLAELGYSHLLNSKLALHGTARLLYHDLFAESGFGVGFHGGLLYQPIEKMRLGLEVTDILSTTLFWSSGLTEVYAPQVFLGADYYLSFKKIPFIIHPIVQAEISLTGKQAELNKETWGYATGLEIGFQNQLFIQLGRNSLDQFQVGARIRTKYIDLHYGTGFSELTTVAGQTHRVGVGLNIGEFDLF
ncbi:MAG: hypothetical protein HON27_12010 [Candidatus Marinimicrobia bacterium]|jgi:hypothetical protein|nr:hypothetical protein [Candidatus Neomarinimicrobiota bacterium]MBT4359786.1 hypothetical protein [Candidatus Neomarinimicrobiota bacterium]MBT4946883.1 hypothetical protein [Candidatus Neomarinimicrobiota bacterium]MBT5270811.1 hypothetical protein [Candidatus Neomarinimicrobiota bacterium]MBT6012159.1 hypothetical protein [Candidatus Neomarinimicrobiota bacterium]